MTAAWPAGEALLRDAPGDWSISIRDGDGAARWDHRADLPRAAASTIKLAVLVSLCRAVDAGRLRLAATRALAAGDKVGGSGVLGALHDGLRLTLADPAYLMIAISDNTASNLLIDAVGHDAVNATLRDLGLRRTVLGRKFRGRPTAPGERENVTTANDLTALLAAILAGPPAAHSAERCEGSPRAAGSPPAGAASRDWMLALLHAQQHRERLARLLPPEIAYAGKTGSLPGTALDAGILFAPSGPLIVAAIATELPHHFAADETMGRLALLASAAFGVRNTDQSGRRLNHQDAKGAKEGRSS
jgi:beta-lactamase class A